MPQTSGSSLVLISAADYWTSTFLRMQHFVDYGIILALNPTANLSNIRLQLNRLPYPPYVQDTWKRDFPGSTAKLIQVTYLFFIISITKDVTYDKESRMRVCDII